MPDNFDKERRTVSLPCIVCGWKFRCPVEQLGRVLCRACESEHDAKATARA